ncbi:hypothetical protein ACFL0M_12880, partial [Thermodesulfobacteriota bacterium]
QHRIKCLSFLSASNFLILSSSDSFSSSLGSEGIFSVEGDSSVVVNFGAPVSGDVALFVGLVSGGSAIAEEKRRNLAKLIKEKEFEDSKLIFEPCIAAKFGGLGGGSTVTPAPTLTEKIINVFNTQYRPRKKIDYISKNESTTIRENKKLTNSATHLKLKSK